MELTGSITGTQLDLNVNVALTWWFVSSYNTWQGLSSNYQYSTWTSSLDIDEFLTPFYSYQWAWNMILILLVFWLYFLWVKFDKNY